MLEDAAATLGKMVMRHFGQLGIAESVHTQTLVIWINFSDAPNSRLLCEMVLSTTHSVILAAISYVHSWAPRVQNS